jgi:hypothetical protein
MQFSQNCAITSSSVPPSFKPLLKEFLHVLVRYNHSAYSRALFPDFPEVYSSRYGQRTTFSMVETTLRSEYRQHTSKFFFLCGSNLERIHLTLVFVNQILLCFPTYPRQSERSPTITPASILFGYTKLRTKIQPTRLQILFQSRAACSFLALATYIAQRACTVFLSEKRKGTEPMHCRERNPKSIELEA